MDGERQLLPEIHSHQREAMSSHYTGFAMAWVSMLALHAESAFTHGALCSTGVGRQVSMCLLACPLVQQLYFASHGDCFCCD